MQIFYLQPICRRYLQRSNYLSISTLQAFGCRWQMFLCFFNFIEEGLRIKIRVTTVSHKPNSPLCPPCPLWWKESKLHRNELNVALMNGSRVRGGEGRFITFYFIIFYTISFFIYKKKYESYKSTLTTPHPWPISYNKKITGNLKNSIVFFRFTTTFLEYSIILFKTVQEWIKF